MEDASALRAKFRYSLKILQELLALLVYGAATSTGPHICRTVIPQSATQVAQVPGRLLGVHSVLRSVAARPVLTFFGYLSPQNLFLRGVSSRSQCRVAFGCVGYSRTCPLSQILWVAVPYSSSRSGRTALALGSPTDGHVNVSIVTPECHKFNVSKSANVAVSYS